MSKDTVITSLLSLPIDDQREILSILTLRLGPDELSLSEAQLKELDARMDRFEREGSRGEPWEKVYAELRAGLVHARNKN